MMPDTLYVKYQKRSIKLTFEKDRLNLQNMQRKIKKKGKQNFILYKELNISNNFHHINSQLHGFSYTIFSKVFDEIWTIFLGEIFFHSSMVTCSNSRKFFGDWQFIQTFNSCHRFLIGLKSGLVEGHGRTVFLFFWSHAVIYLDVYLGSLSCWKVNCRPRRRYCADSYRFSFRILI